MSRTLIHTISCSFKNLLICVREACIRHGAHAEVQTQLLGLVFSSHLYVGSVDPAQVRCQSYEASTNTH